MNEAIKKADKQRDERCDQLFKLGLKYNGAEYFKDDINVHWTEITCDNKEVWDEKIKKITAEIERRKKQR